MNQRSTTHRTERRTLARLLLALGTAALLLGQVTAAAAGRQQRPTPDQIVYYKVAEDPSSVSLNITNGCPNACAFCIRGQSKGWRSGQNLFLNSNPSYEEVRQSLLPLLTAPDSTIKLVKFCGYGEPALRLDLVIRLSSEIKDLVRSGQVRSDLKLQLNTSGWPVMLHRIGGFQGGEVALRELKKAGVDRLSISLNAPTQKLYDAVVRPSTMNSSSAGNAFEMTKDCIRTASQLGLEVRATMVAMPGLDGPIAKWRTRRLALQLGASEFVARPYVSTTPRERALPRLFRQAVGSARGLLGKLRSAPTAAR